MLYVTVDSEPWVSIGTFKATRDFVKIEIICKNLCGISIGWEVVLDVLIWYLICCKVVIESAIKATL